MQQCGTLELSRLPPANQERQIQARFFLYPVIVVVVVVVNFKQGEADSGKILLCSVVVVETRHCTKKLKTRRGRFRQDSVFCFTYIVVARKVSQ